MTDAATALFHARTKGGLVATGVLEGITDLSKAYEVQRAQLATSQEVISGWKIGATSAAAQEVLGLSGAVFGPIADGTVYPSGASAPLYEDHGNFVESEFAVTLAEALPTRATPHSRAEIAQRVKAIQASFELVGCRLEQGLKGAGALVVADFGVNGGAVLGDEIPRDLWDNLDALAVTLTIDGAEAAQGSGAVIGWGHVFDAVAWMASQQALMARPLAAGDVILTGTCTGVIPIKPGMALHADFGGVAEVEVALDG